MSRREENKIFLPFPLDEKAIYRILFSHETIYRIVRMKGTENFPPEYIEKGV